jgi:hypothetical protein
MSMTDLFDMSGRVVTPVLYLASLSSSFTTGAVIELSGGVR